jgi:hypothetical protein
MSQRRMGLGEQQLMCPEGAHVVVASYDRSQRLATDTQLAVPVWMLFQVRLGRQGCAMCTRVAVRGCPLRPCRGLVIEFAPRCASSNMAPACVAISHAPACLERGQCGQL